MKYRPEVTDQQALEAIERICGDDFCEDLAMRDLEPNSDLLIASEKVNHIFRIAHSFARSHSCFHVHDEWRQEVSAPQETRSADSTGGTGFEPGAVLGRGGTDGARACSDLSADEERGRMSDYELRYFIDTEFVESGPHRPIEMISIGIVAEDGREYYAISSEFDRSESNEWVDKNVLPKLESPDQVPRKALWRIAAEIRDFVGAEIPEFWGYYADYDWVVFCQIFGRMIDLPEGWPMFCRDIMELKADCKWDGLALPPQPENQHNALSDAQWNKQALYVLENPPEYCRRGVYSQANHTSASDILRVEP